MKFKIKNSYLLLLSLTFTACNLMSDDYYYDSRKKFYKKAGASDKKAGRLAFQDEFMRDAYSNSDKKKALSEDQKYFRDYDWSGSAE